MTSIQHKQYPAWREEPHLSKSWKELLVFDMIGEESLVFVEHLTWQFLVDRCNSIVAFFTPHLQSLQPSAGDELGQPAHAKYTSGGRQRHLIWDVNRRGKTPILQCTPSTFNTTGTMISCVFTCTLFCGFWIVFRLFASTECLPRSPSSRTWKRTCKPSKI